MGKPTDRSTKIVIIEALRLIAQIHIDRLTVFFDEGEMHFTIGIDDLKAQTDHLTPEEWDKLEDYFLDRREDLKAFLELNKHFSIVRLFTVFEMFLRATLRELHGSDPAMLMCIRKMSVFNMKKEFSKIGVPIAKPNRDWHAILGTKAVRNCIIHAGGHPDKELAKKLTKYTIPVKQSKMMLEGYFGECVDLVERACERIAKDCQDALREGRLKIKNPTVAGLMDSLLERPRGVLYSDLSTKAQALADDLGHKTKWTEGEVKKHARFRDRQTTGRWNNLTLVEWEDKSGGRLIDKS